MKFRGEYSFLSNFHDVGMLEYNGLVYKNAEAAFQAAKCKNNSDKEVFTKMTGTEAKRNGRKVVMREDWPHIKVLVMYRILLKKFSSEPMRTMLLQTAGVELVEENTWGDTFWGVCGGKGLNMLGKLLMQVRSEV